MWGEGGQLSDKNTISLILVSKLDSNSSITHLTTRYSPRLSKMPLAGLCLGGRNLIIESK